MGIVNAGQLEIYEEIPKTCVNLLKMFCLTEDQMLPNALLILLKQLNKRKGSCKSRRMEKLTCKGKTETCINQRDR